MENNIIIIEQLGKAFAKKALGQTLTTEEVALLAEHSGKLAETAKKVKTESKAANETAAKEKTEKHVAEIKACITDAITQLTIFSEKPETEISGISLKSLLKTISGNVPVLKGSKGSGTGNSGLTEKTGTLKTDSYAGVCLAALQAAKGKPVTFAKLAEAVHKAKPESEKLNSAGKEPLSYVYIKRVPVWFPKVSVTGKGTKMIFTLPVEK